MTYIRFMIISLFMATAAAAQTGLNFTTVVSDPNSPVDVRADQLQVDQDTGKAVFSGNVRAVQELMRLGADRVEVDYNEAERRVEKMFAFGNVIFVSPNEEAESTNASYDPEGGFLEMWGEVLVIQGGTAISGDRLKVNLRTGKAEMIGSVRTVFGSE